MLLSIPIGVNPNLFTLGGFVLTWHGFFTFVAVAVVVWLSSRSGERAGVHPDIAYSVAVWAILGGVVGARLVHVIDRWDYYQFNLLQTLYVWEPGIAVWGAVMGAFVGAVLFTQLNAGEGKRLRTKLRVLENQLAAASGDARKKVEQELTVTQRKLEMAHQKSQIGLFADIAAPFAILGMGIGRIGDIINGEHIGVSTTMPWGFVYSHPGSPTNFFLGLTPTHPAVVYEMILDFVIAWALIKFQPRLRPYGMTFALLMACYAVSRFFVSFYRLRGGPAGEKVWGLGLSEAQWISIIILLIAVPLLAFRAQWLRRPRPLQMPPPPAPPPSVAEAAEETAEKK